MRDLDAPVLVDDVEHETTSIGHNTYVEGRYAFASNYTAGLRVFDITGGQMLEPGVPAARGGGRYR